MSLLPRLSVVIPTWNRAHLVCDAVESALAQGPQVEVAAVQIVEMDDVGRRERRVTHRAHQRRPQQRIGQAEESMGAALNEPFEPAGPQHLYPGRGSGRLGRLADDHRDLMAALAVAAAQVL